MPELVHPALLDPRLADLERPQYSGVTGGLCRALAQRWQVDPIIVRLVMLALTFAGGVGIALYAWGWLLTPRVGGAPPILRWLPAFACWPRNTQAIIIAVSSLVLVLSVARQTGVAWGPVIVVGALAWGLARRRRRSHESSPSALSNFGPSLAQQRVPGERVPAEPDSAGRATDETVEQWRSRLSPHAEHPLPSIDLYAPEPAAPPQSPPNPSTSRRTSWWAALFIVVLSVAAGAVPFALGMSPSLLWASFVATGTATALILGWALGSRRRQLPLVVLIIALMGGAGTGLLASTHAAIPVHGVVATGGDPDYTFVGEVPVDVDLTELAGHSSTVLIDATASVVRIRLRELPQDIEVLSETIEVETNYPRSGLPVGELKILVDGDFSVIEVTVEP